MLVIPITLAELLSCKLLSTLAAGINQLYSSNMMEITSGDLSLSCGDQMNVIAKYPKISAMYLIFHVMLLYSKCTQPWTNEL